MRVLAQGPANTSPYTAVYFDNRPHYIPANSSLWYRFDYAGDKSLILMKMFGATNSGVDFNIYANGQETPFGRGTAINVPCDAGKCPAPDLTWKGATPIGGTYYIEVTNSNSKPLIFYLVIAGERVALGPPIQDVIPSAQSSPAAAPPTPPNIQQDNQPQTNPLDTLWYSFESGPDR